MNDEAEFYLIIPAPNAYDNQRLLSGDIQLPRDINYLAGIPQAKVSFQHPTIYDAPIDRKTVYRIRYFGDRTEVTSIVPKDHH